MRELTAEQLEWINGRPENVRRVALKFPPNVCYRLKGNPGHYWIYSYGEPEDGGAVTVRFVVMHPRSPHLPSAIDSGLQNWKAVDVRGDLLFVTIQSDICKLWFRQTS